MNDVVSPSSLGTIRMRVKCPPFGRTVTSRISLSAFGSRHIATARPAWSSERCSLAGPGSMGDAAVPYFTLSMLTSRSSREIISCSRRTAMIPASLSRFASSAPLYPTASRAICLRWASSFERSTLSASACTFKIFRRLLSEGLSSRMTRSKRPGLRSAWSSDPARLVAPITMILSFCVPKPSICTRSSIRPASRSLVSAPGAPVLAVPMESISSMKIMLGAFSRAMPNRLATSFSLSPIHLLTSAEELTEKKVLSASVATALAR
mmetsp:Transcript_3374/g.11708  ORF Transcript_3374/g.11708 Transcript_3374/m.11708 type:complete len:265 (+) Transcript_3374:605-1399(+)